MSGAEGSEGLQNLNCIVGEDVLPRSVDQLACAVLHGHAAGIRSVFSATPRPAPNEGATAADDEAGAAALAAAVSKPGRVACTQREVLNNNGSDSAHVQHSGDAVSKLDVLNVVNVEEEAKVVKRKDVYAAVEEPEGVLSLPEECVDGLYCSATGVWRPYLLISESGLVSPEEEGWQLVRFKSGKVLRVERGLCVDFEEELVGARVDEGVWQRLREGQERKKPKKARSREESKAEEAEERVLEERDRVLEGFPVKLAMMVSLGLMADEISQEQLDVRLRDKRLHEFWLSEYNRRVVEAGGAEEFFKWVRFVQGMLGAKGRKPWGQAAWEKKERELVISERLRQERSDKAVQEKEKRRLGWRLEVKRGGGQWLRVPEVDWGCDPKISRGLAESLGVEQHEWHTQLKVKAVQHGEGESAMQLWDFEVIDEPGEWLVVRGAGLQIGDPAARNSRTSACGDPAARNSQTSSVRDPAAPKSEGKGIGKGKGEKGGPGELRSSVEGKVGVPRKRGRVEESGLGGSSDESLQLWLQCPVSGQWVRCDDAKRTGEPSISRFMVQQLGANVVKGWVLLQVKLKPDGQSVPVWFRVSEEPLPDVGWSGVGVWRRVQARQPSDEAYCRWEGEVEWLCGSGESEEGFWEEKEAEAVARAREAGEEGCVHEGKEAQPHSEVLGPWLHGAEQKEGHAFEYTRERDAPEWLREKKSVFVAGGMIIKEGMYEKWRAAGADAEILGWIKQGGYEVRVSDDGATGIFKKNGKIARENGTALAVLVCELLLKETWEIVAETELRQNGNILPLNLAPKPTKDPPWRIICNAIDLNCFVQTWRVRYESVKSCGILMREGDWAFSIDLEDAYYSCLLKSSCRNLFGAKVAMPAEQLRKLKEAGLLPQELEGEDSSGAEVCVRPRGLPMGFTNSCAIWTKISRVLTRMWKERGWRVIGYIDDFCFFARSKQEAWVMLKQALLDIESLGLAPSYKKTIVPTKRLKFLGILIDCDLMRFFVPGEKVEKLKELARAVEARDVATMRELASVAGKVVSMSVAIPAARLLTRACYQLVRPVRDDELGYDKEVEVSEDVRREMRDLLQWIDVWNQKGAPIKRRIQMQEVRVIADAGTGWGYRLDGVARGLEFGEGVVAQAGEWSEGEREYYQPWKELVVFEKMLEIEGERLRGASLLFLSDATAAVAYINKGSGPSELMSKVMRRIFSRCVELELSVWADHISGDLMKDAGVDSLSRWGEFSVAKGVFKAFDSNPRWGRYGGAKGYDMDLYASRKSARCERFCARRSAEGAVGDARTHVCSEEENHWVCPPLPLIERAVQQFWEQGVLGTVVVPDWENANWHLFLRERAVHSVALPWCRESPTMVDVASKKVERHGVDKWGFRAFLVDNRGARGVLGGVLPTKRRLVLSEEEQGKVVQGVELQNIRCRRYLRVVDLFSGLGSVPFMLERLGVRAHVLEVELDEAARRVAQANAPSSVQAEPHDVWYWASEEGLKRLIALAPDLLTAGFPCQSVSGAAPKGRGLQGKSGVFEALKTILAALKEALPNLDFVVECTDFSRRHKEDFRYVSAQLGVQPVILCASDLAACYRRRAYWASFKVEEIERVEVDPNSVLEPGRVTQWKKLPTIVASGVTSWNTRQIVEEQGRLGPLSISEMERAMQFDVGYTDVEGLSLKDRYRLIGNAFHAGVLRHLLLNYISCKCLSFMVTRDDCRGDGKPFEMNQDGPWGAWGFASEAEPKNEQLGAEKGEWNVSERLAQVGRVQGHVWQAVQWGMRLGGKAVGGQGCKAEAKGQSGTKASAKGRQEAPKEVLGGVVDVGGSSGVWGAWGFEKEKVEGKVVVNGELLGAKRKREAAWRQLVQGDREQLESASSMGSLLAEREGVKGMQLKRLSYDRKRKQLEVPKEGSLLDFAVELADDYAVMSKAEATWKSYKGWQEVLVAFGVRFGIDNLDQVSQELRVELVRLTAALLSMSYSMGTIDIFVAACSSMFKVKGWGPFWGVESFKATMAGIKRSLGTRAEKKPPIEPWHVMEMLEMECPEGWSELQWKQAQTLILLGFELFNRRQDFGRLQPCDFREVKSVEGKRVWELLIRYAKNDVQGLTRAPQIIQADDERCCLGTRLEEYMGVLGIKRHADCNKVWGKPYPCDFCEPLFPAIWAKQGKKCHAMPDSRVGRVVKGAFRALAKAKPNLLSSEEAEKFSTKSLRTGGVSSAAAECVRDGVLQGHGGWLARESLRHYDQMKEGERTSVGQALGKAVERLFGEGRGLGEQREVGEQRARVRVGAVEPRSVDSESDDGGEESEDEGTVVRDRVYEVKELLGARRSRGMQQFLVAWKGHPDQTWEFEVDLIEEGAEGAVSAYLLEFTRTGSRRVKARAGT